MDCRRRRCLSFARCHSVPDRVRMLTEDYRFSTPGGVDLVQDAEDCSDCRRATAVQPFLVSWVGRSRPRARGNYDAV